MTVKRDVERLEEFLEVSGPASDEDVLGCLADVLSSAQVPAILAAMRGDGYVGRIVGFVIPSPGLIEKLIPLVRLDDQFTDGMLDDASDAQIGYAVETVLYQLVPSSRVEDEDLLRLLNSYPDDQELIEAIKAIRPPRTGKTMGELMAEPGE